jgi:hypothetical protein
VNAVKSFSVGKGETANTAYQTGYRNGHTKGSAKVHKTYAGPSRVWRRNAVDKGSSSAAGENAVADTVELRHDSSLNTMQIKVQLAATYTAGTRRMNIAAILLDTVMDDLHF